jgi:hypothetical protein
MRSAHHCSRLVHVDITHNTGHTALHRRERSKRAQTTCSATGGDYTPVALGAEHRGYAAVFPSITSRLEHELEEAALSAARSIGEWIRPWSLGIANEEIIS